MAKKLNKKVFYSVLAVGIFACLAVVIVGFRYLRERNPEYCLDKARQAAEAMDFQAAEIYYGKAYGHTELDDARINLLFEMAKFHLTVGPKHEPNWRGALACWNTVLNIKPQHIEARRNVLDYFYQAADNGVNSLWKQVDEHASKLLEDFEQARQAPESKVLLAAARANLEIARLGSETYRQQRIDQAMKLLEQLKKLTPEDVEVYEYLAQAVLLKGELDEVGGVKNARTNAQQNAQALLQGAIPVVADKGSANAYLMEFKLRQSQTDPDLLSGLREEVKTLTETYPDSDRLYSVLSACYELPGKTDRKEELITAAQNAEKALEAAGGKHPIYTIRAATLWYRIGAFYDVKENVDRAIQMAEKALTYPESTILPGPKESAAKQNRFMIQNFLARCFVEQAVNAKHAGDDTGAKSFYDKASKSVAEMTQIAGGSTTMIARQWQGMLALAEGKDEQAFRLLYKVYEEAKSLDKTGQVSTIDSYLCYILSRLAVTQGSLGMQREFLEKALYNRNSIAPDKPTAILDYANIMLNLQAGSRVTEMLNSYIQVYGQTPAVQLMLVQADLQTGKFEDALTRLDKMDPADPEVINVRLLATNLQLNRLRGKQALDDKGSSDADQKEIEKIRARQVELLSELLKQKPQQVDPQIFASACRDLMNAGEFNKAKEWISLIDAVYPESVTIQLLKLQLAEPEPTNISPDRQRELMETAIRQIKDPVRQALQLGQHYRAIGKVEQAKELYEKAYKQSPDSIEIASDYFGFLLEQKDVQNAEAVFSKIRGRNPDGLEGNLFAAQLEVAKENYPTALRRLDECVSIRPGSAQAIMLKSQVYLLQKNYASAVENARLAYQVDPQSGTAARMLASAIYERNRNFGTAVTTEQTAELERAIGVAMLLNPSDWKLQSVYAEAIEPKDPQRALAMRQALFKAVPNASNALMLGNMAMRMARAETDTAKQQVFSEMAGNAYQQAYQMEPASQEVQRYYSEYLRSTGQRQKAEGLFSKDQSALWRFYLSDGQYAQAADILEKLLGQNDNDIDAAQGLVEAYQGMSQWEKMRAPLDRLARKELTADQEIWLIQKYLDAGINEESEKRLASFQERYPQDDRGQLLAAWLNMYRGDLEKALDLCQKYLEKNPKNPSGWRLKGRIHRLMGQPQLAIEALQRSKAITADMSIRIELATIYNQVGQVEAALGELATSVDEPQVPIQMLQMLESLYSSNKRFNELTAFYQKMIEKYPNSPFWYIRSGLFLAGQKNYSNALALLEKAWDMSRQNAPGDPTVFNNYLRVLVDAGQLDKALSVASQNVNTPLAPVAYCNIATVQAKQGQNDKAIESFAKAIDKSSGSSSMILGTLAVMGRVMGDDFVEKWCSDKLAADTKFIPAHLILADIEGRRSAYNKAIAHIDQCLLQAKQNSADWINFSSQKADLLLHAYAKTMDSGYLNQALEQLEANLKLQPHNGTTMNNIAYLLADNNIQLDKALQYARRAFQIAPADPVVLDTYAYVLCRNGEFVSAEKYLRRAIQLSERNNTPLAWDVYKHLGMALQGQKKTKEARSAFEKALELGKDLPDKEKLSLEKMVKELSL